MVKITIEIEERFDKILKILSDKNKRSKRNQLLVIVERELELYVKGTNIEVKENKRDFLAEINSDNPAKFFSQGG